MSTPLLTVAEMAAVDAAAADLHVLIERAGAAVAREARRVLGGLYGRRVAVVAGPGNNGADGHVAARVLADSGARVETFAVGSTLAGHRPDLVIDAAIGAGLSRPYDAPALPWDVPVLAVDVPSGLDGDSGEVNGRAWRAVRTVTFGAAKPGHLLGRGPELCGELVVVDIGLDLDVVAPTHFRLQPRHAAGHLLRRASHDHKWRHGVRVIAGSPGMTGAASLTSTAALRAGAGIVVVSSSDGTPLDALPVEAVERLGQAATEALLTEDRCRSVVIGPGLGPVDGGALTSAIAQCHARVVVIDADAISAVADHPGLLRSSQATIVMTPHDGELARLTASGGDRVATVRAVAANYGAVVLSKGPTNVIGAPDGTVVLVDHGDERLATAGSGDVLAGVIAAVVDASPDDAAVAHAVGAASILHAEAARVAGTVGITASDIADHLPVARARLEVTR